MKYMTKFALAAALVLTAAPSHAAKVKVAKCQAGTTCAVCTGKSCELKRCDADGKLYSSMFSRACIPPNCPSKC